MKQARRTLWALLVWLLALAGVLVEGIEGVTLFDGEQILLTDGSLGPYRISERAINRASEKVWLDGALLVRDVDYRMDFARGWLTLLRIVPRGTTLKVRFRQAPLVVDPVYRRRVLPDKGADGKPVWTPPEGRIGGMRRERPVEETALQIGGSKRVQVTVGSGRSHAVNQALEVHISGKVAEGVDVLAVLSDRNLPVQETGSTRGLQDFERIFFQVRSGSVQAGVGDLDVAFDRTQFGRYQRQLQGAHVQFERNGSSVNAFGAVSRGRWTSQRIVPIEGYQGPYRLPGWGSGLLGRIEPESERVYLGGQLLRRGDRLDYVIDYEQGTVTFAPERPIAAGSRITVEYQAREAGLQQRLLGMQSAISLADDRFEVGATVIRESDRAALADVAVPGISGSHQQVAVLDLGYAPREGVRLDGEVALSDGADARGRALHLEGTWAGSEATGLSLSGRYRQVGAGFEEFASLDRVDTEGRWGWQPRVEGQAEREGEVSLRYTTRSQVGIFGTLGRRTGGRASHRRVLGVTLPVGQYRYEAIGQGDGTLVRHAGALGTTIGVFRPGFSFHLENANGDAVRGASIFYATPLAIFPAGVGVRELVWDVETGTSGVWTWRTEVRHRQIRLQNLAWQDSVRAWSFAQQVDVAGWRGWSFLGAYSRSAVRVGHAVQKREVHHLGRVRLRHSRPGLTHQVTYRISRTGVSRRAPIFVAVGRGLGGYVWEDVDGDGVQDPEEFVPDIDGDYERVYADAVGFVPAADGALSARIEADFRRFLGDGLGLLSAVSVDASMTADRQTASGQIAPWQMLSFGREDSILNGQRDVRVRMYLFRYHRRGSIQFAGRLRDRVDGVFYNGSTETLREGRTVGRLRMGRTLDLETEWVLARRDRDGATDFAYDIVSQKATLRELWRPLAGWQLRLGLLGGIDRESQRGLRSVLFSTETQVIRSLPGRGRVRAALDWSQVMSDDALPLFLGMADGNRVGQNWLWRLGVDFRFGRYVTALASYDGRKRPERPMVHLGRMEMRAVF